MIKTYTIGLLLLFFAITTQAQFTDDFNDGDFTNNPTWSGDDSVFIVNASDQLQSNSFTTSNTFYLSTPSTFAANTQWELFVKLALSTSSVNYADIFLIADQQNLKNPLNGYFVRIGNTSDEISLYRKDGTTNTKIIDGVDGHSQTSGTNNLLKIKVTRNATGFTLADDTTGTGNNYYTEGASNDNTYTTSNYFGISITQSTATFFGKHFFDDIYVGSIITDTVPPQITGLTVINNTSLDVLFSEPVEQISAETISNYFANNSIGLPQTAQRDASNLSLVHLTFTTTFPANITDTLTVNNISDLAGKTISLNSFSTFVYNPPVTPDPFDLVINEIMFDPDPVVGLPSAEYVEVFNRSNKTFNLNGWTFSDASSTATFGSQSIAPGGYLILCSNANQPLFSSFGATASFSSLPSLNNTGGETLTLSDNASQIIDRVYYDETFYQDPSKKDGGWSIERFFQRR